MDMKILMVNKFLYPRGGAETYMLQIGEYLKSQGHEVEYFGMYDPRNIVGNSLGLGTVNMDFRSGGLERLRYPFHILYSLEAKRKICRVIRHFSPDVVHLNNIYFHLTPSVIDGAAKLGIPMVETVHDFQMLCPNHMMLDLRNMKPCTRCLSGNKWNCAQRKCIHNSWLKSILGSMEGLLYQKKRTYDNVSRLICPSRFIEKMLQRAPRFRGKTVMLHNFIRPEDTTDTQKRDYVLYFGRLSEEKGIRRLIAACRLVPEIPFVVAGQGPLACLLEGNCPPNVQFVGFKEGQELKELVRQARFSVYLPVWYENCPLSVLESQALGTPVLANAIGGVPELIKDGETGVLLRRFTPEEYAKQIRGLYRDKEKLARMSEQCRKQNDFVTIESYCEKLLDLYRSVML
jgi:glycosyltransferase involved in cell wall biosynthesis